MKKTALLAAAAALLAASPAAAESGGFVGLEYGQGSIDSTDVDTTQAEGEFGWNGGNWGAQIGGSFGNLEFDGGGDADSMTLNGHLYWQGGSWRVGAVAAHTSLDFGGSDELDETVYGVEGMFNISPNANIFGSFTTGEAEFIADADTWNLDAGVNFYAAPNLRLGAFAGTGNLDFGGADGDTTSFGINAEFQPWSFPLSFTAAWNSFELDVVDLEADAFQIGARWNFGGGSVQDRNNVTPFAVHGPLLDRLYGAW